MIVGVVGPVLGGFLAETIGFKAMMMIAAVLYVFATLIRFGMARRVPPGAHTQKLSLDSLKANLGAMFALLTAGGVITWILLTDGVRDISFALSMNLFPVFMEQVGGLTIRQIGLMNSIFGLCMMLTTYPGGLLADRLGERVGIAASFLILGASLLLLVYTPFQNVWVYILGWALAGSGVGLAQPAYQSLISKAVPQKLRGTAFGLFSTSLGLVSLPAPWIGGQLWQNVGPRFPFLITALVSFISAIPAWLKFKLPKAAFADPTGHSDPETTSAP